MFAEPAVAAGGVGTHNNSVAYLQLLTVKLQLAGTFGGDLFDDTYVFMSLDNREGGGNFLSSACILTNLTLEGVLVGTADTGKFCSDDCASLGKFGIREGLHADRAGSGEYRCFYHVSHFEFLLIVKKLSFLCAFLRIMLYYYLSTKSRKIQRKVTHNLCTFHAQFFFPALVIVGRITSNWHVKQISHRLDFQLSSSCSGH